MGDAAAAAKIWRFFGDTTIKIACRAQIRCVGKQQMDPNSTLLKARARALLQVAVRSTASTAAVAEPKAVEKNFGLETTF